MDDNLSGTFFAQAAARCLVRYGRAESIVPVGSWVRNLPDYHRRRDHR